MERKHVEEYRGLSTYFPFFSWKQCSKCKKDFKREKIWRTWTGGGLSGVVRFLCMKCAPTREEAGKFFTNNEFLPHKPAPPPAPPPKRNVPKVGEPEITSWNIGKFKKPKS